MLNLRTFCITLPENPERKEKARKHFQERGLTDVTFFDGIHAEKMGINSHLPYELDHPGSGFRMGYKCTGIWLSHFMLLSALNLMYEEHAMILEDDIKWPENWHVRLSNALRDTPRDFDLIWFGNCCCKDKPTEHIAGEVYSVRFPLCSHGYVVAKKAIPTILKTQRDAKVYAPYDISMALHTMPSLKTFCVLPRLADQWDTIIPE